MCLPESPVSQLPVEENPMASWQEPETTGRATLLPIATLQEPVVAAHAELYPTNVLLLPVALNPLS
jgi:hypothetical protein